MVISSGPVCCLGEEAKSFFTTTSLQEVVECNEVSPEPPLLQTEQAQLPQPLLIRTKGARTINFDEFQQAMKEICVKRFKGKSPEEALQAVHGLIEGKEPSSVGTTKVAKVAGVERLTDTSKYTGSHKERFDESGKGKGLAGREDLTDNSGYVGAYKGAGTYDKTH